MNFRNLAATLIVAGSVTVGACSDSGNSDDVLAQDTSLTRDLALANEDTLSQPQLTDVPLAATPAPVESSAEVAPSPRVERAQPQRARAVTPSRAPVRQPAPRPRSTPPVDDAPVTEVTESGNTVTTGTRGSERPLGVVSAGSELTLTSGQR
ncbi:MAG: hypothetical protein ABIR58_08090, partial [Gemmatimonadaceae bacterium]